MHPNLHTCHVKCFSEVISVLQASAAAGAPTAIAVASEKRKLELELYPLVISIRRMNKVRVCGVGGPFVFKTNASLTGFCSSRRANSRIISSRSCSRVWIRCQSSASVRVSPTSSLTRTTPGCGIARSQP